MTQDLMPKFKFYQDIRLWPKDSDFDYEGWLDNFNPDEQVIAQRILDFFVYFPDDIIDQLFRTVVGRAGYFFRKYDSSWCNESFSNNCWYSFIPGEDPNPSDSGYIYNRKVREVLGVPQERLPTPSLSASSVKRRDSTSWPISQPTSMCAPKKTATVCKP